MKRFAPPTDADILRDTGRRLAAPAAIGDGF
jgi:hypothetical protein